MRVNKRGIGYLVLLAILTLSVTGVSASSMDRFDSLFGRLDARIDAAVESGDITQEQADAKRQRITEGRKQFSQKGMQKPINPQELDRKLQTAVESGKLTQEQANAKRHQITEGRKQFSQKNIRLGMPSGKPGQMFQPPIDSGKRTQEQATKKRKPPTRVNEPPNLEGLISRVQIALNDGMPLEAMQLRIQTGVDRGRFTQDQADAIWANLGISNSD